MSGVTEITAMSVPSANESPRWKARPRRLQRLEDVRAAPNRGRIARLNDAETTATILGATGVPPTAQRPVAPPTPQVPPRRPSAKARPITPYAGPVPRDIIGRSRMLVPQERDATGT